MKSIPSTPSTPAGEPEIGTLAYVHELYWRVEDFLRGSLSRQRVRSWRDLHEICDANEFLIETDDDFGIDWPYTDERYVEFVNEAIALVEILLFGKAE